MDKAVVLDICKHPSPAVQTIILRQGDSDSVTLDITIQEDGEAFDLTEYEARFMASLPNGQVVIDQCEKTGMNTLSYTLPSALAARTGTVNLAYIAIYKDDNWQVSTDCMTFKVLKGVDLSAEEAKSFISEFEDLKRLFEAMVESAETQKEKQQTEWEEQMAAQDEAFREGEEAREAVEATREAAEAAREAAEAAREAAEVRREENVAAAIQNIKEHSVITNEQIDSLF